MKQEYPIIDVFKFIAAILVLSIHTHPFIGDVTIDYYFTCFCRIAVPFFFVSGSYFYFSKKDRSISRYVSRLIQLYIVWFLIEFPLTYERFFVEDDFSLLQRLFLFFKSLLFNSTFYISWYITATITSTVIINWLTTKNKFNLLLVINIICYMLALLNSMYSELITNCHTLYKIISYINYVIVPVNSFIIAIPFVTMGYFISTRKRLLSKKIALSGLFLSFICAFVEVYVCEDIHSKTDTYLSLIPLSYYLMNYLLTLNISLMGGGISKSLDPYLFNSSCDYSGSRVRPRAVAVCLYSNYQCYSSMGNHKDK